MLIPKLIDEFREGLSDSANIDGVIAKWDELKIPGKYMDYVGCFLPCDDQKVHAGPNARKYTRDQSEHPKTSHPETITANLKKKSKSCTLTSAPPKKVLALEHQPPPSKQMNLTASKQQKKQAAAFQFKIDSYLTTIPLVGECIKTMHCIAKGTCLSIVHTGVNKHLSQRAILDNYTAAFKVVLYQEIMKIAKYQT